MKPTLKEINYLKSISKKLFKNDFIYALTYHKQKNWYEKGFYEWTTTHSLIIEELNVDIIKGATKICVIPATGRWVLKFSIDESTNKNKERFKFPYDYCHIELMNYNISHIYSVENYFAEIYCIGKVDNFCIYIQEKIRDNNDFYMQKFSDYYNTNSATILSETPDDMDDYEKLYAIYGDNSDTEQLIKFCDKYHINDLHSSNYGKNFYGKDIIFDYSGYYG